MSQPPEDWPKRTKPAMHPVDETEGQTTAMAVVEHLWPEELSPTVVEVSGANTLEVLALSKEGVWDKVLEMDLEWLLKSYRWPFLIKFRFTTQESQLNPQERDPE